jgi:hypothetical protein
MRNENINLTENSQSRKTRVSGSVTVLPDNFWDIFGLRLTSDTVLINLHFLWLKKNSDFSEKECHNMQNWALWEAFNLRESHPPFPKNENLKTTKEIIQWYKLVLAIYQSKNWYELEWAKECLLSFELKRLEVKRTILENRLLTDR